MIGLPGKHCGVLTDASGFVLETPRDPRTIDFGQLIHWSEAGMEGGGYRNKRHRYRHRGVATG